jgi:lambda family phage portal protein
MIGEFVDKLVGVFSPVRQLRRAVARAQMARVRNASTGRHQSMEEMLGGGSSGYDAAKRNRLTITRSAASLDENSIPRNQIQQLRNDSYELFRNNPHARKICRQLESKVIGRGLQPYPLAAMPSGEPYLEWRARAKQLWRDVGAQLDYRGRVGKGGQHLIELQKSVLRNTILGGEVFVRFRRLTGKQQRELGLTLPVQLQLLRADRLDSTRNDDKTYFGIEFNKSWGRSYYYFLDGGLSIEGDARRIRAGEVVHVFVSDDIDQIRGTPWFSAALIKMRDVGDYEANELLAAAMSACVVLGYRRSSGQSSFGIGSPDGNWDLKDGEGNAITNFSPGMILDLGQNGEMQSFNPLRPNSEAPEFISHMVRTEAASVPGIKPSSLTGDYRGASFSSERAADNDAWPEIEGLQDWMAWTFCQPTFEELVDAAVEEGYFDAVPGFSVGDYAARRADYLRSEWRGPVARSINPKDDAAAASARMKALTSSPQREAALIGVSMQDILEEWEDLSEQLEARGLPAEQIIQQLLGVQPEPEPAVSETGSADDPANQEKLNGE